MLNNKREKDTRANIQNEKTHRVIMVEEQTARLWQWIDGPIWLLSLSLPALFLRNFVAFLLDICIYIYICCINAPSFMGFSFIEWFLSGIRNHQKKTTHTDNPFKPHISQWNCLRCDNFFACTILSHFKHSAAIFSMLLLASLFLYIHRTTYKHICFVLVQNT